ncbi:aminotransferase class I/II-fold pyridoxal phosphate-dependent enzyme [Alicyclobacillus acidoterrestris]|uniref:Aminotransferase class I/II-fold pyridoxal phosphate-dependent enzyme n=1 Tax=Alicyclobacillus acidoterrestris (strain ATCC 49025 / DSM 3922 / CIP 106132 / NCIMB 13137 / GD3B) TaxID=1356854 RepID=T0C9F6_ALIAG|nr:aminotransferase class I/II-fold pyridoxal phosphate-dependent enzyme [Alicyclobacillus acidoterrestris]EPZ52813.1 hypothetical protein N007_19600 [Alicyclobacillus acidoterrestris ATCC 49025]UNO49406.1 aminotransferase class I/II-fold pyridoxal phosphate-dependent enzyme [Alicyclobacillus acidoterrestris]
MNHHETPLFTALKDHIARDPIQFHIPGHKRGRGMNNVFRDFIGTNALEMDLINIAPLDDLHHPTGPIKAAQELAASAFRADSTFFSVQGTSSAIVAMIMSAVKPGDKILVPRNIHKSVLTALIITGAHPIFLHPKLDETFGIAHGLSVESIKDALTQHSDIRAVLVTNPTYFGVACDLKRIVEISHAFGVPVLVDEAHGTHTYFHDSLPLSAMAAGADIAATSVHKLGGSLVGASILNVRSGIIDPLHVQVIMSMLTTTSTSYLMLASLDAARQDLVLHGRERFERAIQMANRIRDEINGIPGLRCLDKRVLQDSATYQIDATKLTISVKDLGIRGYDVELMLRKEFNIEVELSDLYNILCIFTGSETENDMAQLVRGLRFIAEGFSKYSRTPEVSVKLPPLPVLQITPREAFYAKTKRVRLSEAVGETIAETIMVYPPGIPILLPGEMVTQEAIDFTEENLRAGLPVQGTDDPEIQYVKVVCSRS